jgi:hypothetical protein
MLGLWFDGAWLEDVRLEGGVVTGSFEQSVRHHGEERPELPAAEPAGETRWYRQLKVPVVACRFAVREATAIEEFEPENPSWDFWWREHDRRLVFDNGLEIACAYPNLEIEATDRVVGYRRVRFWNILSAESDSPWEDD